MLRNENHSSVETISKMIELQLLGTQFAFEYSVAYTIGKAFNFS